VIASISIDRFKGFEHLEIPSLPRVNLIGGVNNCGKTAFLEAVYLGLERNGNRINKLPSLFRPQSGVNDDRYYWRWLSFEGGDAETRVSLQIAGVGSYQVLWAPKNYPRAIQGEVVTNHADRRLVIPALTPAQTAAWPNVEVFIPAPTLPIEDAQIYIKAAKKAPEGEERIESLLREIEPRLKRIRAFPDEQTNQPLIHVGLTRGEALPANQLGQGFNRLLRIYSSVLCADAKIFLIDEIETGLHHSVLPIFWRGLAALARQENVQIFATTHSREAILDAHRVFSEQPNYDFAYHRLERVNGALKVVTYDQQALSGADARNFEVR